MPMEPYRNEFFDQVKAFAQHLKWWFDYVKDIIKWHTLEKQPGGCWVWRQRGRVVAFCGVFYPNRQDAWLYGMRVDKSFQNTGIATRFTEQLFQVARKDGRKWVGLNTLDTSKPSPVFRIADLLGMKLESIHATDMFWALPEGISGPRPQRMENIFGHFISLGQKTIFCEHPAWTWSRLIPQTRNWVNKYGFQIRGIPVHIAYHGIIREENGWHRSTTVNLFDRPRDFYDILPTILARGIGKHRGVVLNYPAEWKHRLGRAVHHIVPELKRGKNHWPSVWRIYGKYLR